MKKSWLRGTLLGVSLALLLAGGVAVAQTLTLEADQDCVECWPGPGAIPDDHVVLISMDGWDPQVVYCDNLYFNGESVYEGGEPYCQDPPNENPPAAVGYFYWDCKPDTEGKWELRVCQPGTGGQVCDPGQDEADWASATFRFAEVCEVEFVPEPGTIALLGSGLAGLAGYATLRWRART